MFICPATNDRYLCLSCPLPQCKFDGKEYYAQRNREIYLYWKKYQKKPLAERPKLQAIAYKFGVNTRQQVWEIIKRESKVKACRQKTQK